MKTVNGISAALLVACLLAGTTAIAAVDKNYYVYVAAESDDTVHLVRFGPAGGELVRRFHGALPFPLTGAQIRTIGEIETGAISVELGEAPGVTQRKPMFGGEDEHEDEHEQAEEHDEDHADADHDTHEHHDHGGIDPHVWLDPENGKATVAVRSTTTSRA